MVAEPSYELLVIILDDIDKLPAMLDALHEAGVSGMTLLSSIGGYRARTWLDEIGLSGLHKMFGTPELRRRTLLTVMKADQIDRAIAAAELALGGFDRENSGILFTLPVRRVLGLHKRYRTPESETLPATDLTDIAIRHTPLTRVPHITNLQPITLPTDATLQQAAQAFTQNPSIHVASVISQTGHLLGIVPLQLLANYFFFGIMPEIFYGKITTDYEQSLDFGKMANVHNVADLMLDPVSVQRQDTVGQAFALMHKHDLSGLPLVDENMHVIGLVTLQRLMSFALTQLSHRKEGD